MMIQKVCIIGVSGKLGKYMVDECLDRGYEVTGVCRPQSVEKVDKRVTIYPGTTDDAEVVAKAVEGCDGVLTVLVPWGVNGFSMGTARAVVENAKDKRLVFSSGWHCKNKDNLDQYSLGLKILFGAVGFVGKVFRLVDLSDQERACDYIYDSNTKWTVNRACMLDEGPSEGFPVWSRHIGDPILSSNLKASMRRQDFAKFMVESLTNDDLIHEAPALVGCQTESALKFPDGRT